MTPAVSTVDLPLRGLASEGVAPSVEAALLALPGVVAATVHASAFRAHVTYDSARVTLEAIRERLHAVRASPAPGTHGSTYTHDSEAR